MTKQKNGTIEKAHAGKVKWAVKQALNGGNLAVALATVKANPTTISAAETVYQIALGAIAQKVRA